MSCLYQTAPVYVKRKLKNYWDGQGTSYPPEKDKVYDVYVLTET